MKEKRLRNKINYQMLGLFAISFILIIISFWDFVLQSHKYLEDEMYAQAQAQAVNATNVLNQEVETLKRITSTAALLTDQHDSISSQEIVEKLQTFADKGDLVRTLFITLEGHAYTNYAGYLGQSDDNLQIGDVLIKDIKTASVMQPFYSDSIKLTIFGVATPMRLGQYEGILISSYNVNQFRDVLKSNFLQGVIQTSIVSQDGKTILGKNDSEFGIDVFTELICKDVKFTKGSAEKMRKDFKNGESDIISYKLNGEKRYIAYMATGINDWYVTTSIPEDALMTQIVTIQKSGSLLAIKLIGIMIAVFVVIMITHLKEEKSIRKVLRDAAMYDGLTGIYNRASIEEIVGEFLSIPKSEGRYCMFIMDIDAFKNINDTYGHLAGDEVLVVIADRLQCLFGSDAIVGRLGGDEFLVFMQNYNSDAEIIKMAEQIIQPISIKKFLQMPPVFVSIGISLYPRDGTDFLELYQCADKALYKAKQNGKKGFAFYDKTN